VTDVGYSVRSRKKEAVKKAVNVTTLKHLNTKAEPVSETPYTAYTVFR
jgi:hypothetical protein